MRTSRLLGFLVKCKRGGTALRCSKALGKLIGNLRARNSLRGASPAGAGARCGAGHFLLAQGLMRRGRDRRCRAGRSRKQLTIRFADHSVVFAKRKPHPHLPVPLQTGAQKGSVLVNGMVGWFTPAAFTGHRVSGEVYVGVICIRCRQPDRLYDPAQRQYSAAAFA
jgi:hypothetical protein